MFFSHNNLLHFCFSVKKKVYNYFVYFLFNIKNIDIFVLWYKTILLNLIYLLNILAMKKFVLPLLITSVFSFVMVFSASAQLSSNVKFAFTKEKGKLVKMDEKRQKVAEFMISGLSNPADMEKIQTQFRNNKSVISFNISSDVVNGNRKAKLVCLKSFKMEDFKIILQSLGIKQVTVDGLTKDVSEIGTKKSSGKPGAAGY